jgi:hypothetical protein
MGGRLVVWNGSTKKVSIVVIHLPSRYIPNIPPTRIHTYLPGYLSRYMYIGRLADLSAAEI